MSVMFQRETLTGAADATHKITIPGTTFQAWTLSEELAVKLAAKLAKTTVPGPGKRRRKAQPVITPIKQEAAQ